MKTQCLPMKSAKTERAPIQSPPKAAAVGIYLEGKRSFKIQFNFLFQNYSTV